MKGRLKWRDNRCTRTTPQRKRQRRFIEWKQIKWNCWINKFWKKTKTENCHRNYMLYTSIKRQIVIHHHTHTTTPVEWFETKKKTINFQWRTSIESQNEIQILLFRCACDLMKTDINLKSKHYLRYYLNLTGIIASRCLRSRASYLCVSFEMPFELKTRKNKNKIINCKFNKL